MNASSPIPLLGPAGTISPVLPGQTPGSTDSVFAESLSIILSGAQVQPLVPAPNPVTGLGKLDIALTSEAGSLTLDVGIDGIDDLTASLLGTEIGTQDNLSGPIAPSPNLSIEQGLQGPQDALTENAGRPSLAPAINPVQDLNSDFGPDQPPALLNGASLSAAQNKREDGASNLALTAGAASFPDEAALPEQALPQLRQILAGRTDQKTTTDVIDNTVNPSNQQSAIDSSKIVANPTLRPALDQGTKQPSPHSISGQQLTAPSEGHLSNAEHLAHVRAHGVKSQSSLSTLMPTKPLPSGFEQSAAATEILINNVQPSAEPIEIFSSETGRVDPVNVTSSKPQVQQTQAPNTQVALQIMRAVPQGLDRFSVQLNPAELGSVEIQLDFAEDGHVSALITAERPETLDMLQRDSRALERTLNDTGLQLESGGLSFSLKQEQNQQGEGFNPSSQQYSESYAKGRGHDGEGDNSLGQEPARISQQRLLDIRT